MNLEIQTQHIDMQPGWRAIIEQRLERLAARYPEIVRVHVTVRHGGHHRLGTEEVDIIANCARATLRTAKQEQHVRDAVHAALDALERKLAAHHETPRTRRHFARSRTGT